MLPKKADWELFDRYAVTTNWPAGEPAGIRPRGRGIWNLEVRKFKPWPCTNWPSGYSIFALRNLCEIIGINPDGTKRGVNRGLQRALPLPRPAGLTPA
jgi:hypothetical protein